MSVARQRRKSARKVSAVKLDPTAILSTSDQRDNVVTGTREIREVRVTQRVSIKRQFNAPRIDMGEYSPVATIDAELDKGRKGWTIEPDRF